MKIALDYDETFTEDPVLWSSFIELCKERLHTVTFVTYRSKLGDNSDILSDAASLSIDVVFTGGKQKSGCFDADIWIDDMPITIPKFIELGDMYDGCLVNGDIE